MVLNKLKPWLHAQHLQDSSSGAEVDADALESTLQLREWQQTLLSLTQLASKYKVRYGGCVGCVVRAGTGLWAVLDGGVGTHHCAVGAHAAQHMPMVMRDQWHACVWLLAVEPAAVTPQ